MWRFALLIGLACSVALNVYLLMQLNVSAIEKTIQQAAVHPKHSAAQLKKHQKPKNDLARAKGVQQLANKIKKAIKIKDYFKASFLINTLAHDYPAQLPHIRSFWLHASKALIQKKLFTDAENSISAYLEFQPDDGGFLYQQVDLYWQQQLPLLAIKSAYEVQYHVFNEVEIANAINFARDLAQQYVDVLINNNLWLELSDLVVEVLLYDPQNLNLQWLFARAQYQLGEFDYARNALEPLLNQPNYKIKAQAFLAEIEAEIEVMLRKPQSIPLSRQGEHFIVQALINDTFNVSLMLDTGASISLLSESAFATLSQYSDVAYMKDLRLNTAGGIVTARIYQVTEFAIQDYIVNDFIFAVSPSYASEGNDGLLGMNFLSAFDFHIDQSNSLLMLKSK